jgi:hypothetical protein
MFSLFSFSRQSKASDEPELAGNVPSVPWFQCDNAIRHNTGTPIHAGARCNAEHTFQAG